MASSVMLFFEYMLIVHVKITWVDSNDNNKRKRIGLSLAKKG
jgi:hypothetical protein